MTSVAALKKELASQLNGDEGGELQLSAGMQVRVAELMVENRRLRRTLRTIRKRCDGRLGPGRATAVNEIADMADAAL